MKAMCKEKLHFALLLAVAVLGGMGISCCKKDQPTQPPSQPGHTALTLQATFTSIRWCRLEWNNDSTAPSHRYLLVRNGRDTVFNDTVAVGVKTAVVQDTGLKPGTNYSYWVYRIVNGAHWDSASVGVRTKDTSSDQISWNLLRICKAGSHLNGICSTGPGDYWISGWMPNDTGIYQLLHLKDGVYTFFDLQSDSWVGGCFATSDSSVWVCGNATVYHWDGHSLTSYGTWNDSFPSTWMQHFRDVWESPDLKDVFAVGVGGLIIHRSAAGKWTQMQSGTPVPLVSIRAFSAQDIYVAGGNGSEGDLLHFDGTSWMLILQSIPPDSVVNVANILDVWGESPDSLMLAGNSVYHREGTTWQDRMPNGPNAYVNGVCSTSWNNVIACGEFGMVTHFDGEHWKQYSQFFDPSSDLSFRRVTMVGNQVCVIGYDGKSSVLLLGHF
jgi:hypothetical protein